MCPVPLSPVQRAQDDRGPEALLALVPAPAAKPVVGDTVAVVEEERPFQFSLFAHARHTPHLLD